jgi:predicted dehydrogenase
MRRKNRISRREFMERSVGGAAAAAGLAAAGRTLNAGPPRRRLAPSDQITMGVIGAGIRGLEDMQTAMDAGANIAMVCDLYDGHLRRAQEIKSGVPVTRDYRQVLDRKDIDAVLVATSDHWHQPVAVAAMKAGKDVYCEKPMTHTIPQALEMVRVSKDTGRVVQVGSQSLSMQSTHQGKAWVDAGEIGTIYNVQCEIYRPDPIGAWKYPVPPDASPQTIDWDRYQENIPDKRAFDAARFFQFRNWWDYGTGIAGDEYVHLLSRVHYLMNVQYPLSGVAYGGIYHWTGDRDVPDIHNTLYDYGKFQVVVLANLVTNWDGGEIVRFMGDKGTVVLTEESASLRPYHECWEYGYPLESWPRDLKQQFIAAHKNDPSSDIGGCRSQISAPKNFRQTAEGTLDHMHNFFDAVRNRTQPIENVDFGCGTAVACHMANISYRQKQRVFWDAEKQELTGSHGSVDVNMS